MKAPKWNGVKHRKQAVGLERKRSEGCGWLGGQDLEDRELCQLHQGCLGAAIRPKRLEMETCQISSLLVTWSEFPQDHGKPQQTQESMTLHSDQSQNHSKQSSQTKAAICSDAIPTTQRFGCHVLVQRGDPGSVKPTLTSSSQERVKHGRKRAIRQTRT